MSEEQDKIITTLNQLLKEATETNKYLLAQNTLLANILIAAEAVKRTIGGG